VTPKSAKAWYRAGSAHADLQEWGRAYTCLTTAAGLLDPVTEAADLKVCVAGLGGGGAGAPPPPPRLTGHTISHQLPLARYCFCSMHHC
jgi:hypothetical protein